MIFCIKTQLISVFVYFLENLLLLVTVCYLIHYIFTIKKNEKWKAVWALGNVAGDSPRCRDLVLASGALLPLLAQLNEHAKLSMLRNATWTLSNFCRGKPQPAFEQVYMHTWPAQSFVVFLPGKNS